jgi:Na+/H+ antiporter
MQALEFAVAILSAVLVLTWLARRTGISEPVVLLLGGIGLRFAPGMQNVSLPPDVVLFLFLPALLYWETLGTSLREIRANLRVIVLLSVGLVLATAAAVAVAAHALGMAWATAFVLGAVVAPTDATAVAAIGGELPRRFLTTLRAESLINDGTALAVFGVAVAVAVGGERFSLGGTLVAFVLSYAGGAVAGVAAAGVAVLLRRLFAEPLLQNGVSLLTPLLAYLAAEAIHGSGVIAVVVCGFILAYLAPLGVPALTRVQAQDFWSLASFLINGALFVLVGLQIPRAVRALLEQRLFGLREAAAYAVVTILVVIGTRIAWGFTTAYVIRALDRRPQQRLRRVGARARFVTAWAGARGAVSLAAALAVPATIASSGAAFAPRHLIIVVTAAVILATLIGQGLTLPAVIRWARLPTDTREHDEGVLARRTVSQAGLDAVAAEAARLATPDAVRDAVAAEMRAHLEDLDLEDLVDGDEHRARHAEVQLRLALLGHKRRALVDLRNAGRIDDGVLQHVQRMLDAEEVRLATREHYVQPVETDAPVGRA